MHKHIPVSRSLRATDINGYSEASHRVKEAFHRDGQKFLRALAKALGLADGSYDVRSNKAGPAVSGEVTLHGDEIYAQLYESCTSRGISLMYRTCDSRKDYTGHQNNFASVATLDDEDQQCALIAKMQRLISAARARRQAPAGA